MIALVASFQPHQFRTDWYHGGNTLQPPSVQRRRSRPLVLHPPWLEHLLTSAPGETPDFDLQLKARPSHIKETWVNMFDIVWWCRPGFELFPLRMLVPVILFRFAEREPMSLFMAWCCCNLEAHWVVFSRIRIARTVCCSIFWDIRPMLTV